MKSSIIWVGVASLVVGVALIVVAFDADLDPLAAVPEDAAIVVSADLRAIQEEASSERAQAAFDGDLPGLGLLDDLVTEGMGISIIEDVMPWSAGPVAMWASPSSHDRCVIAEVDDRSGADAFVDEVRALDGIRSESARDVEGGTVHVLEFDGMTATVGRLGAGVYLCAGDGLDASLAALASTSILDVEEARALVGDDLLVAWLDLPALLGGDTSLFGTGLALDAERLAPAVITYGVDDVGIRWGITTDADLFGEVIDDSLVEMLPADTALGAVAAIPDLGIPFGDRGEAVPGLQDLLGVVELLDGSVGFGLVSSNDALLGQVLGAPIDLVLSVESPDPHALAESLLGLVGERLELPLGGIEEEKTDDGTAYSLSIPFLGDLAVLSATDDTLTLSGTRENALGEGPLLVDTEEWQAAVGALEDGSSVLLWIDPKGLQDLDLGLLFEGLTGFADLGGDVSLPDMDLSGLTDVFAHDAIDAVVAGGATNGGTTTMELLVLVDW